MPLQAFASQSRQVFQSMSLKTRAFQHGVDSFVRDSNPKVGNESLHFTLGNALWGIHQPNVDVF